MASTSPEAKVNKEKKSKLWSTPEFPGNQRKSGRHRKSAKKHQTASNERGPEESKPAKPSISDSAPKPILPSTQATKAASGSPVPIRPSQATATATPSVNALKSRPGYPSQSSVFRADTHSFRERGHVRTYGLMTVGYNGKLLDPSMEAIDARMTCMYPGFRQLIETADNEDAEIKQREPGRPSHLSRAGHVKKIWSIAMSVIEEAKAVILHNDSNDFDVIKDSSFGMRINYLVNMCGYTRGISITGRAVGRRVGSLDTSIEKTDPPSHEEILAYKVLTKHYLFPIYMATILRESQFEYLMYPLPPINPGVEGNQAQIKGSDTKESIGALEANPQDAEEKLSQQKRDIDVMKQQAEAEAKQRCADILRDAKKQLKKNEARSAEIKEMISYLKKSLQKAEMLHSKRLSSEEQFLQQIKRWREEGKLDEDSSSEEDSEEDSEEETDDGAEKTAGHKRNRRKDKGEGELDKGVQRPAKIRRIS